MHAAETRIFYAVLMAVIVLGTLMTFFIVTIVRFQKKKIALYNERINAEINALETDRSRIANDLHDDIGSQLSAIKLRLQTLTNFNLADNATVEKLEEYIDAAMQKLRHISFNMMPPVLTRKGLAEAVQELLSTMFYSTGIKINANITVQLNNDLLAIHIYRIIQEILNNIIRHAKATQVKIELKNGNQKIKLHIADNGVGFDTTVVKTQITGQGLNNIMARADLLKAKIYVTAAPGTGVDYVIEIPNA